MTWLVQATYMVTVSNKGTHGGPERVDDMYADLTSLPDEAAANRTAAYKRENPETWSPEGSWGHDVRVVAPKGHKNHNRERRAA